MDEPELYDCALCDDARELNPAEVINHFQTIHPDHWQLVLHALHESAKWN
jgi:hypothetical protein